MCDYRWNRPDVAGMMRLHYNLLTETHFFSAIGLCVAEKGGCSGLRIRSFVSMYTEHASLLAGEGPAPTGIHNPKYPIFSFIVNRFLQ